MATLITLVDNTVPVAADFNTNFTNLNTELRPPTTGGTGLSSATLNGVLVGNATAAMTVTSSGAANQVLAVPAPAALSSGGGRPWSARTATTWPSRSTGPTPGPSARAASSGSSPWRCVWPRSCR